MTLERVDKISDAQIEQTAPVLNISALEKFYNDDNNAHLKDDIVHEWTKIALKGSDDVARQQVAEVLGTAARKEIWRVTLAETGILTISLSLLKQQNLKIELIRQLLRVTANCVADSDKNRQILVDNGAVPQVIQFVKQNDLRSFALAVLFNLCLDFEPAQTLILNNDALSIFLDVLRKSKSEAGKAQPQDIYHVMKLFEILLALDDAHEECPSDALPLLLGFSKNNGYDIYLALCKAITALLGSVTFQKLALESAILNGLLDLLEESYIRIQHYTRDEEMEEVDAQEEENTMQQMRTSYIDKLSNISFLDNFLDIYPLPSMVIKRLEGWLMSEKQDLVIAAAIMLGNIARSEIVCTTLVFEHKIASTLVCVLRDAHLVGVLHAVSGLLKNLAISTVDIKVHIGDHGAIEACDKMLQKDQLSQIHYIGLSLLRILIAGTPSNVRRLFKTDSPSSSYGGDRVDTIIALFNRSDELPIKTEIGRIIASILRTLRSSTNDEPVKSYSARENGVTANSTELDSEAILLNCQENIAQPLIFMVVQDQWASIRSEGWFALALVAQSALGATKVAATIKNKDFLSAMMSSLSRGQELKSLIDVPDLDNVKLGDDKATKDNTMVFLVEMSKNLPQEEKVLAQALKEVLNGRPIGDFQTELSSIFNYSTIKKEPAVEHEEALSDQDMATEGTL